MYGHASTEGTGALPFCKDYYSVLNYWLDGAKVSANMLVNWPHDDAMSNSMYWPIHSDLYVIESKCISH